MRCPHCVRTAENCACPPRTAHMVAALIPPPEGGDTRLHPATAALVDRFAAALKDKLAAAEKKYGYGDGWLDDHWQDDLVTKLAEHVQKGDPRDVAAFCAFAWHHGWSIAAPGGDTVTVPREPTREMLNAAIDTDSFKLGDISPLGFRCSPQAMFERCWTAMIAAAPTNTTAGKGPEQ